MTFNYQRYGSYVGSNIGSDAKTGRFDISQGYVVGDDNPLYTFSSFTFTTGGIIGRTGGSLSNFQTAYSAYAWTQDTAFFNVATNGFQRWVVPDNGTYRFDINGAQGGGGGGYGARVILDMILQKSDELLITVGHRGINTNQTYRPSSGGGCSGVYTNVSANDDNSTSTFILAIAGGGGGRSIGTNSALVTGMHGSTSTSGQNGQSSPFWRNTTGGTNGAGSTGGGGTGGAGPGAGYLTNGADSSNSAGFAKDAGNSWLGGNTRTSGQETSTGAFGGAGGASVNSGNYRGGGGGGGYSGGGAGVGDGAGSAGRGGGGGSFCVALGSPSMDMITLNGLENVVRDVTNRVIYGGSTTNTNGNSLSAGDYSGAADGYVTVTKL